MKTLEERRKDFFEEGVSFYAYDTRRRAFKIIGGNFNCRYRLGRKKCMIGRHIPDDKYNERLEGNSIDSPKMSYLLPKEIQELGTSFLQYTQNFHDNSENWNKRKGLTFKGKERYKEILDLYCK